jgi:hypothetical protein
MQQPAGSSHGGTQIVPSSLVTQQEPVAEREPIEASAEAPITKTRTKMRMTLFTASLLSSLDASGLFDGGRDQFRIGRWNSWERKLGICDMGRPRIDRVATTAGVRLDVAVAAAISTFGDDVAGAVLQ